MTEAEAHTEPPTAPRAARQPVMRALVESARWRVRLVAGFCVLALTLSAVGVPIGRRAAACFAAWLLASGLTFLIVRRLRRAGRAEQVRIVSMLGFVADCSAQAYLYVQLGGGAWMAETFLLFSAFTINATLPRRYAVPATLYAAALAAALPLAEAAGRVGGTGLFGTSPLLRDHNLAAFTAVIGAALVGCAAFIQQSLTHDVRRASARHRLVLESASDMIFTLDRSLRVDTINVAVLESSGFAREAIVGRGFADLLLPDDATAARGHLERVLDGVDQRFDTRYRRGDGAVRWLAVTASPVRDGREVAAAMAIARDVTDLRTAEEHRERMQAQLAQSQKMDAVGQLVSGVAHELNNPLAAVLTFVEELLVEPRTPSDAQALRTIREQTLRARSIVRDLRAFVRQGETETDRAHPSDVVARVVRAATKASRDANATVHVVVAPEAPAADIPRASLKQVVANLVLNAIHAVGAEGGGTVTVTVGGAGASEIVVEDDGAGIPAEVLPHIFEPFFTTRPTGQGTGLGLSVSLGIAEQYGGTIAVETRPAVAGTRFTVRLPALPADATIMTTTGELPVPHESSALASRRPATPPSAAVVVEAPRRVLVIDDESSIRLALRRFFTRRGWQVEDAGDGGTALARLLEAAPDAFSVILCDLKMPGLSGPQLYRELEQSAPHWLDRLILSSGDVAAPETAAFLATARCPVLEKPFELSALATAVEAARQRAGTTAAA